MANIANWVAENCSTVGTGNLTLSGSVDQKDAVSFSASLPAGEVWYSIQDGANREAGIGTFDGNNTIIRATVHATKTGNTYNNINPSPLSLSGQSIVGCTFNTQAFDEFLTGINNKLPLDGSLPMTGSLKIGDGITGNAIHIRENTTNPGANFALFRADNTLSTAFYHSDGDERTVIATYDLLGDLVTEFDIKYNGLVSVLDGAGGVSDPLADEDLTNKKFVESALAGKVSSDTAETGTSQIVNMVSLTQAAYDALTPVSTTFYVIVG